MIVEWRRWRRNKRTTSASLIPLHTFIADGPPTAGRRLDGLHGRRQAADGHLTRL